MQDCIIIGGGPAGLTAAIYLVRKKVNIQVLSNSLGGQIMDGPLIENYPGFEQLPGPDWVTKVKEQADKLGVKFELNAEVTKISQENNIFAVETTNGKFEGKSVLIASGKTPRKLGVPGEEEFLGKGVSHCVTCDGPLFSGKTVAVIGGGNSAISAALELEKYAQKVYVINLGSALIGEEVRIDQLKKSTKVEIIGQAKTTAISGSKFVESLKYQDLSSSQEKKIACQGIIVEIGWVPSTKYLEGFVELSDTKEIKIDKENATSVPGVFAAGDVTEIPYKQLVIAAGQGANAAMSVWDYLSKLK
ncbi:MAG: FAD-dependent oxidoreductase [Patescibacteria group bacterium]|jgi:alkyl hydroperoxide reductase subunit F